MGLNLAVEARSEGVMTLVTVQKLVFGGHDYTFERYFTAILTRDIERTQESGTSTGSYAGLSETSLR